MKKKDENKYGIFPCAWCGESFKRLISKNKGKKFLACSSSCRSKYLMAHVTDSHRAKIGLKTKQRSLQQGDSFHGFKKGHKTFLTSEHYESLHEKFKGDGCYAWKGGITSENHKIRNSLEYRKWRKNIFERDDYTCMMPFCGIRGGKINANHILTFKSYPEKRLDISNGITLCVECHRHIHFKEDMYSNLFIKILEHAG